MLLSGCLEHRIHQKRTDQRHIARVVGPTDKDIHLDRHTDLPYSSFTCGAQQSKECHAEKREKLGHKRVEAQARPEMISTADFTQRAPGFDAFPECDHQRGTKPTKSSGTVHLVRYVSDRW